MKRVTIILILTIASLSIWGQGGGYGSGAGYPSTSLIAQGVVTYYRTTTQGGNAPKWYDINALGTSYISRDSVSGVSSLDTNALHYTKLALYKTITSFNSDSVNFATNADIADLYIKNAVKLNISDTTVLFSKRDSATLHYTKLAAKLNYTDTAALHYVKLAAKLAYTDTASLHYTKLALKLNISDTASFAAGIKNSIPTTAGVTISTILPFGTATVSTTGLVVTITKDGIVPAFTSSTGYEVSRFELISENLSGTRRWLYYGVDYTVSVGTNTVTFTGITNFITGEKVYFRFR